MAERRMFAKTIVDSDAFLDMPLSTQALYFHLSMRADDDGFINKPKSIMRMCGCNDDDMKLLITKKFLIPFESGVVVIKHWKIHNYIRKDTYTETKYKVEKSTLSLDENEAYAQGRNRAVTDMPQVSDGTLTQVRLGKDRLGKDRDIYSPAEAEQIVAYMNKKWGTNYRPATRATVSLIQARLNEGFTTEDFIRVIDNQTAEWKHDSKMKKFLRPQTLFSGKFESYLNSEVSDEAEKKRLAEEAGEIMEKGGTVW